MSELSDQLREYFEQRRRALLSELDGIERMLAVSPRTAELRKGAKRPDKVFDAVRDKWVELDTMQDLNPYR